MSSSPGSPGSPASNGSPGSPASNGSRPGATRGGPGGDAEARLTAYLGSVGLEWELGGRPGE
ncbi:MAG: hypothetical protein HOQ13_02380, partial [Dermatophilaceae bacterium]|nr:hypothetical protein [Dermatophilaceae bacterium]